MKSTAEILEPFTSQILRECAENGRFPGLRLAGKLSGYKGHGFPKWLWEKTADENFGLHPTNPKTRSSSFWLIRQKIDDTVLELLHAMDSIADGERRKIEAGKELRLALFQYKEARKNNEREMRLANWEWGNKKPELCELVDDSLFDKFRAKEVME